MKNFRSKLIRKYAGILALILVVLGVLASCKKDDGNNEPVAEYGTVSAKYIKINPDHY